MTVEEPFNGEISYSSLSYLWEKKIEIKFLKVQSCLKKELYTNEDTVKINIKNTLGLCFLILT